MLVRIVVRVLYCAGFLNGLGSRRTGWSPDGNQWSPLMDTCNTTGVASALAIFNPLPPDWASCILTGRNTAQVRIYAGSVSQWYLFGRAGPFIGKRGFSTIRHARRQIIWWTIAAAHVHPVQWYLVNWLVVDLSYTVSYLDFFSLAY